MTRLAHDRAVRSRTRSGLALALLSASSFGLSGALADGLIAVGWSPGAAVTARVLVAAGVLAWPAWRSLRGSSRQLRSHLGTVLVYGVVAVAGCQLCYFYAVAHMQVGVALLVEYTAPVAVVGWLWARHGERPGRATVVGAVVAGAGLVLVLDLVSGAGVSLVGMLWALGAMAGAATYFVVSGDASTGLPPLVLAAGGLAGGGLALLVAGAIGVLPMTVSAAEVAYAGGRVPWWLPVLGLGLVTAALAYTSGIAATRRLGSRLASFVGLGEVLAAVVFAWLLLGQLPGPLQLVGGLLVVAGVVAVKLDERPPEPGPVVRHQSATPTSARPGTGPGHRCEAPSCGRSARSAGASRR
ncbi:MAG: EamA family transporter [Marmoricola sp.]